MCTEVKLILALYLLTSCFIDCKIYVDSKEDGTHLGKHEAKECENTIMFEALTNDIEHQFSSDLKQQKVSIAYGKSILLLCYGVDAERLTITGDGQELQIQKIEKAIKWSKRSPDVQNSEYVCTDAVTACKKTVFVKVIPVFEVLSLNTRLSNDKSEKTLTIQYGDSMLISCVGSATSRLVMTKNRKELHTEKDGNAIRWFVSEPELQISDYVCTDITTTVTNILHIKVEPRVYILSGETTDHPTLSKYGLYTYGDSIEIFCSAPRAMKIIRIDDNTEILTERVNKSTVKSIIKNLKIGESTYGCVGSEELELISTVNVEVRPRMEVVSPNMRYMGQEYVTKVGDPVEIICFGPDAAKLHMSTTPFIADKLQIVNETTVKNIIKPYKIKHYYMSCTYTNESGINIVSEVYVRVDNFAEAVQVECVSHNLDFLNCSWSSLTKAVTFTFFLKTDGKLTNICTKASLRKGSKSCRWDYSNDYSVRNKRVLNFLMQSCNYYGCSNQSFHVDHAYIVKLEAPEGLRIRNKNSTGAVLRWMANYMHMGFMSFRSGRGDFLYKVEYWYSGIQPLEVNTSLVYCDHYECQFDLKLPCPGQYYHVSIYQKVKQAAEDLWSQPSSISFSIDGENKLKDGCNWKPAVTKEVMTYFAQQLIYGVNLELLRLRKKIVSIKTKRAKIRAYLEELKESDRN